MERNLLQFKINAEYALIQGLYWVLYCIILGFSSVYLLDKGYTNSQIGVILAVGFLASVILQQYVAALADRALGLTLPTITILCVLLLGICCLGIILSGHISIFLTVVFILACIIEMLIQPLVNSLNFYLEKIPVKMNFGVARSMGSLLYSAASFFFGIAIKQTNPDILPFYALIVCGCIILLLAAVNYNYRHNISPISPKSTRSFEKLQISGFIYQYSMFFIFLIGGLGLYFGHTLINNYLYQITVNVNGNSQDLGSLQAFSALLELPAMIFFATLQKRFGCRKLLQASAVFFIIKIVITLFATNIFLLYLSMVFQSLSFAVFIPGSVHYVNEVMLPNDAVKGQAFVTGMITIANLLSSLLGGILLDQSGVFTMLTIGTIVTIIGAGITIYSLQQSQNEC